MPHLLIDSPERVDIPRYPVCCPTSRDRWYTRLARALGGVRIETRIRVKISSRWVPVGNFGDFSMILGGLVCDYGLNSDPIESSCEASISAVPGSWITNRVPRTIYSSRRIDWEVQDKLVTNWYSSNLMLHSKTMDFDSFWQKSLVLVWLKK